MKIDENAWASFQRHLGYTDEQMAKFRSDPKNEKVLLKAPELLNKTIIAEVVDSTGCNSRHKVGDRFVMDGAGNLISKLCPSRMCVHAVQALSQGVLAVNELVYAGVDPNEMVFRRTGCVDVGVECGGWGRIVMEIRVEDRSNTGSSPKK